MKVGREGWGVMKEGNFLYSCNWRRRRGGVKCRKFEMYWTYRKSRERSGTGIEVKGCIGGGLPDTREQCRGAKYIVSYGSFMLLCFTVLFDMTHAMIASRDPRETL